MKTKLKLYTVRLPESVIEELRKAAKDLCVTDQCFVINALRAEILRATLPPEIYEGSDL